MTYHLMIWAQGHEPKGRSRGEYRSPKGGGCLISQPDPGLNTLLDLDGSVLEQEGGYWIKIDAKTAAVTTYLPHGIRYSLTLHDRYGTRVLGYDNAHAVKSPKKFKFAGQRLPFDHRHRSSSDQGVPCMFESAQQLLEHFFAEVDSIIWESLT